MTSSTTATNAWTTGSRRARWRSRWRRRPIFALAARRGVEAGCVLLVSNRAVGESELPGRRRRCTPPNCGSARSRSRRSAELLLQASDRVLDRRQALIDADRGPARSSSRSEIRSSPSSSPSIRCETDAQATGQPLDVGSRTAGSARSSPAPERARRARARRTRPSRVPVTIGFLQQVLGDLADRLLPLSGHAAADSVAFFGHGHQLTA